jgi:hypothetical protein
MCVVTHNENNFYLHQIKLESVHLIGLPPLSPAPSSPRLAVKLLSCLTAAALSCIELL